MVLLREPASSGRKRARGDDQMPKRRKLHERIALGPIVADGAMGTQVAKLDLEAGAPPESLNLSRPGEIESIHRSYVEAGAEIVLTNTFGANALRLEEFQLANKQHEINVEAARIARRAAGEKRLVLGDMGPTGRDYRLPPYGDEDPKTVLRCFSDQARALADDGVDGILVETMMSLHEACLAVRAAREGCDLPVLCSVSFKKPAESRPDDFRTFWGDDVKTVVRRLSDAGAEALGSNCGELVEEMPLLAACIRAETGLPLIFEVNAGRPGLDARHSTVYELEPTVFAAIGKDLVTAGANIVGGCCGTTPEHIRALRMAVSDQ